MNRNSNSILMAIYILFIFVSVFTRSLYAQTKWEHIVAAITITSWMFVLSDSFLASTNFLHEANSTLKPAFESLQNRIQHNRHINPRLDAQLLDEQGRDIKNTIGQALDSMEQSIIDTLNGLGKSVLVEKWLTFFSNLFLCIAFIAFFCILFYEPVFAFCNRKLDEATVLSFGCILCTRFVIEYLEKCVQKMSSALKTQNEAMELLNQSYKSEVQNNAD